MLNILLGVSVDESGKPEMCLISYMGRSLSGLSLSYHPLIPSAVPEKGTEGCIFVMLFLGTGCEDVKMSTSLRMMESELYLGIALFICGVTLE